MSRLDKQRRKELLREVKRKEVATAFDALPLANVEFQSLFDMLDVKLPIDGCDHSRRLTIAHIRERSLPEDAVLQWLDDNAGFCDCQVLSNSEQAWRGLQRFCSGIIVDRTVERGRPGFARPSMLCDTSWRW